MPQTSMHSQRVRHLSAWLARGCFLVAFALPLTVLGYWVLADAADLAALGHLRPSAVQAPLLAWQRLAGALCTLAPAGLAAFGLWQAHLCFRGFAQGRVFTSDAVLRLRRFAACMGGSALAAMIAAPLLSALLTWENRPGTRQLVVGIGSDQVFALLFAGMVWLMASVIAQGQELADENAAFV